ncbi:MAG: DUF1854 domain-containing protein [bacterium]|jgi:hypothetical protein|nr:DUF1854 domain-containing protein [bacterium]
MTTPLSGEMNFLPANTRFYVNSFGDLAVQVSEEVHENIQVERAFPLNAPEEFIVARNNEGDEIGILEKIRDLGRDSRIILQDALAQAYYLPQILTIHSVETHFHIPKWRVDTDRGPREFEIPSSRRDVRVMAGGRVLLRDADGNRYEIKDYRKLDPESQAIVETMI